MFLAQIRSYRAFKERKYFERIDRYRVVAAKLVAGARSRAVLLVGTVADTVSLTVAAQRRVDTLRAVLALKRGIGRTRYTNQTNAAMCMLKAKFHYAS